MVNRKSTEKCKWFDGTTKTTEIAETTRIMKIRKIVYKIQGMRGHCLIAYLEFSFSEKRLHVKPELLSGNLD